MKISVILCTYNGASRLPATLEKLAAQTLPAECLWEVILIDNASTDDTPVVARQIATNFPVPLRVLHEPQPGKANALHTAFREAAGEYYCVVDDDNLLESEYLTQGILFLDQHSD
ncbi:MAG TPA: glycosyltransferase, partial [Planctomycetaceae bacterium]|nr:glycosyltransferase [Planctomycetaceae bacterium]